MCPPALKDNKVQSGWEDLVEFVRTAYEGYLAGRECEGQSDSLTVFTYIHGQKTFVSLACTGDDDRIISVCFVVETPQYQTHECLSCEDQKDTHREFDMDFKAGDTDAKQMSLGEKLKTLRKTAAQLYPRVKQPVEMQHGGELSNAQTEGERTMERTDSMG